MERQIRRTAESKAGRISDELPNLNQGMSICLEGGSKDEGSEHLKAHNCDDIILKKVTQVIHQELFL